MVTDSKFNAVVPQERDVAVLGLLFLLSCSQVTWLGRPVAGVLLLHLPLSMPCSVGYLQCHAHQQPPNPFSEALGSLEDVK